MDQPFRQSYLFRCSPSNSLTYWVQRPALYLNALYLNSLCNAASNPRLTVCYSLCLSIDFETSCPAEYNFGFGSLVTAMSSLTAAVPFESDTPLLRFRYFPWAEADSLVDTILRCFNSREPFGLGPEEVRALFHNWANPEGQASRLGMPPVLYESLENARHRRTGMPGLSAFWLW